MSSAARALVVSLALAVSLLGVAGGAGAGAHLAAVPAGTAHAGTLSWHDCDASYLCATLRVPISYRHPKQGSLGLAIVELQANGPARGDIVLNPGGPGVSGVAMLESLGFPAPYPWSDLLAHYNLVSFDPRGVGESDPVHCLSTSAVRDWLRLDGNPQGP
ncbi:MAG TPA: hypothetical protein VMD59_07515, partial [Acidimicrobiales bacterium]|nr:hypothetical protein [Acidimicrobiales bacterium]